MPICSRIEPNPTYLKNKLTFFIKNTSLYSNQSRNQTPTCNCTWLRLKDSELNFHPEKLSIFPQHSSFQQLLDIEHREHQWKIEQGSRQTAGSKFKIQALPETQKIKPLLFCGMPPLRKIWTGLNIWSKNALINIILLLTSYIVYING